MPQGTLRIAYSRRMGRSILLSVLVAAVSAVIIWMLGRLLDSQTLSSVAIAAGAGAGVGYFITTRTNRGTRSGPGR